VPAAAARGLGPPPASGGEGGSSWGDARRFVQYAGRALAAAGLPDRRSPSELASWAAAACADEGGGGAGAGAEEGATSAEGAEGAEGAGGEGGREDRAVAAAGRRLAAFEALRAVLAPAVETLLLMDQLLFMQAGGHRGPAASRHHLPTQSHPHAIPMPSDPSCTYSYRPRFGNLKRSAGGGIRRATAAPL